MIKPQAKKVLLLPDKKKTETDTGIYIGENNPKSTEYGTVAAIGDEVDLITKGQRVLFSPGAATEFPYEGINYLLIRELDVLGIVDENSNT